MLGLVASWFGYVSRQSATRDRVAREQAQAQAYSASQSYRRIKAKYDNARTDNDNSDLWRWADSLSARGANDLATRKKLRERARYETSNSAHCRGITLTIATDAIGTGPRLQCLYEDPRKSDEENEAYCDEIERAWETWANEINLAEKLHTFFLASVVDGEAFALLTTNNNLMSSVRLDVRLIECDMVTDPGNVRTATNILDGIEFDEFGNPAWYHVLRQHPGDSSAMLAGRQGSDRVPARQFIHFFRTDRPHQVRGVSELTPALHLFAQLRRYTLAVLEAAEIAADFAVFIQSQATPEETANVVPFSTTDIDKGLITSLPKGYQAFQLKAEQPTTTFDSFTKGLLREACHCLNIPYNVASADFEGDSYAGGRMAQSVYQRYVGVRRKHFMARVLDRIFQAWLEEATKIDGLLPADVPAFAGSVPHTWFFDEWVHVDPLKEANATQVELIMGTTTLADEWAKKGHDWRKKLKQKGKEIGMLQELGALILPPGTPPLDGAPQNQNQNAPPANEAQPV